MEGEQKTNHESNKERILRKIKKRDLIEGIDEEEVVDESDYQVVVEIFQTYKRRTSWNSPPECSWDYLNEYIFGNDQKLSFSIKDNRVESLTVRALERPIPESLLRLNALEHLGVYCSDLTRNPWLLQSFRKMTSVKGLSVTLKKKDRLPDEISDLSNLEEITLYTAINITLPRSFDKLSNLKAFSIFFYMGERNNIPHGVSYFQNLERLSIYEAYSLTALPPETGNLKKLKFLYLHKTHDLVTFPDEIGDLINLESIHIKGAKDFSTLPPTMKNLKRLRTISLCTKVQENASLLATLLKLVHDLPYLGCLGNIFSNKHGIKNDPIKLSLLIALLHNQFRVELGVMDSLDQAIIVDHDQWPFIFERADQVSRWMCCEHLIFQSDCIFHLLKTYFVREGLFRTAPSRKRKFKTT